MLLITDSCLISGVFNTIPTPGTYTADFLKALANETLV
jgi:hypothetical protein